jgi:deoxycytidine triphosphate deaminase
MFIVGDDILKQELLKDADRKHIKNSSYYLTIGAIIPAGEEAKKYDPGKPNPMLVIGPRQVAWVVSKEVFNIKSHDITALVTLRSTFTKKGLLALDVGMVDPEFEGPIGSIVINFSKNNVQLRAGEEFFRVVFIKHSDVPAEFRTPRDKTTALDYIMKRHGEIVQDFPATFLDTDVLSDQMAAKLAQNLSSTILDQMLLHVIKNYWGKLLGVILLLGALITGIVYLINASVGPNLSRQDVQKIIQNLVEQKFLKGPSSQ